MSLYKLLSKNRKNESNQFGYLSEVQLEWFEKETVKYLFSYFQSGSFVFVRKIVKQAQFQIENFSRNSLDELIELSFIRFLAFQASNLKNFLYDWTKKIVINSVDNTIVLNNQIEGKILWKDTFRERNYLKYPKSTKFVCFSSKNNYNSLENILIKSFIIFLKRIFDKYDSVFKFSLINSKGEDKKDWKYFAASIHNNLKQILSNYYMREIIYKRDEWKNQYLLTRALKSCNKNNYLLLLYAKLFNDLKTLKNPELLKRLFINFIFKPNQEKTAELFVLFTIIERLSSLEDGNENRYLISPTESQNYVFEKQLSKDTTIKVYYHSQPDWIVFKHPNESSYKKTVENYKLHKDKLQSDIIIEILHKNNKMITLIEVVNSSEKIYIHKKLQQISNFYDILNTNQNSTKFEKKGILLVRSLPKDWKKKFENIENIDNYFYIDILEFQDLLNLEDYYFMNKLFQMPDRNFIYRGDCSTHLSEQAKEDIRRYQIVMTIRKHIDWLKRDPRAYKKYIMSLGNF